MENRIIFYGAREDVGKDRGYLLKNNHMIMVVCILNSYSLYKESNPISERE
jgi:hypothetical protein